MGFFNKPDKCITYEEFHLIFINVSQYNQKKFLSIFIISFNFRIFKHNELIDSMMNVF